tara:strand:+ start:1620 stop:1796 length:177 start_codon:yes stop_codon:yes gene_type:complete
MKQTKTLTVPFKTMLDEGIYLDSEKVNGWEVAGLPYFEVDIEGDEQWHMKLERTVTEV